MSFATATLTGTYQLPDGTPARGFVEIIPNSKVVVDQAGNVIRTGRTKVDLDTAGHFSVSLIATDDATLEPATGRQYTILVTLHDSRTAVPKLPGITLATGTTVDTADLTSGVEASAVYSAFLTKDGYTADLAAILAAAEAYSDSHTPVIASATTTAQGVVELATNTEATTGTDTARAVTPSGLKAVTDTLPVALGGTFAPHVSGRQAQRVTTAGDGSTTLVASTPPPFATVTNPDLAPLTVSPSERFQPILGFGAALTDAAAYVLSTYMSDTARHNLLTEMFSPTQGNLSTLRIGFGATDFQSDTDSYTYDDTQSTSVPDTGLVNFSIAKDGIRILPILREILAIQPRLRVFVSIWKPPPWMNNVGNHATSTYYPTLAAYIVKSIQAYQAAGIPIYAIAPVNEPSLSGYTSAEVAALIGYLGPAMATAGLRDIKILAGDDSWGVSTTSQDVILSDATALRYSDGVAWHCYSGSPTVMKATAEKFPGKAHYITEIRHLGTQDWATTLQLMAGYVAIGGIRNGAQAVTLWNLALDQAGNPQQGSPGRRGVVTVDNTTGAVTRSASYYVLLHLAKYLQPGAVRCASSHYSTYSSAMVASTISSGQYGTGLESVAYVNPDDSIVVFAYNPTASPITTMVIDARTGLGFPVTIAPNEMDTFLWGTSAYDTPAGTPATLSAPSAPVVTAVGSNGQVILTWPAPASQLKISGYVLYKGTASGAATRLVDLTPDALSYTDRNTAGGTFYYQLVAQSAAGNSAKSTEVSATCAARSAPAAPTSFTTVAGTGRVTLGWGLDKSVSPIDFIRVKRGTVSGTRTTLIDLPANATGYTDTTTVDGTTYYYSVQTFNFGGQSGETAESAPMLPLGYLLDAVTAPAARAYGIRKLRAAYAGYAIRVRRTSDNTEQDIGFTGTGDLDTTTLLTFAGAGGAAYVKTWYDQSGNGKDLVQATTSAQARIVQSGALETVGTSSPALFFGGTAVYSDATPTLYAAGASSLATVVKGSTFPSERIVCESNSGDNNPAYSILGQAAANTNAVQFIRNDTGGNPLTDNGGATPALADNASHQILATDTGSSASLYTDGTQNGTARAYTRTGTLTLNTFAIGTWVRPTGGVFFNGRLGEVVLWASVLSTNDQTVAKTSEKRYYGTP